MKTFVRCLVVVCLSALIGSILFAQSNQGSITGAILDPAGTVVPTAEIEVKNQDTGIVFLGGPSATGNYVIAVPSGTYELTVTVPGFKKYIRQNLLVTTATAVRQDVNLEIGSTTETLTVTADAPLLKTETGEVSHRVTTNQADNLPVLSLSGGTWSGATSLGNIRNPLSSAMLLPGVVFSNDQTMSVNGLPSNSQAIRIEGQDSTSTIWKVRQQDSQGGVDAIEEVSVQTSNFAAEYGQAGGGYFNFTMKSGTNTYHGSAYDYIANEVLNAGTPFTDAGTRDSRRAGQHIRNPVRRNDYGFTFGGPIWIPKIYDGHDKTFVFFNFEQFRENRVTFNGLATVPTDAYRNGDFGLNNCRVFNSASGTCTAFFADLQVGGQSLRDPALQTLPYGGVYDPKSLRVVNGAQVKTLFPNNVMPKTYFDPVAVRIQDLLPHATRNALINNYDIPAYSNFQHSTNPSFKIDHSISPTIKISTYVSRQLQLTPNANGFPDTWGGAVVNDNRNTTSRFNYDQAIRPTVLLHLGIGYFTTSRPNEPTPYDQTQLGLKGFYDTSIFPTIGGLNNTSTGGWGPNGAGLGGSFKAVIMEQKPTANANLTWVKGNHTYKFGGEYTGEGYPVYSSWRANGNFTFSGNQTANPFVYGQATQYTSEGAANGSGFNWASFLLGYPDSMGLSQRTQTRLGNKMFGAYAQDAWKVTRKFTLEYGIRYDYQTYLKEQYGRMANASFTEFNRTVGRPGAIIYEGEGAGRCNCVFSHNYPFAFGPRLSGAYQIDSKTVLRAGAGVSYGVTQTPQGSSYSVADFYTINAPGFGASPLAATGGLAGGNPYALGNPYGNPELTWPNFDTSKFPTRTVDGLPPQTPFIYYNPESRPARIVSWSVALQRELMRNLVFEASYVGNRGAWFYSPKLDSQASNSLTPDILKAAGLDLSKADDRAMLLRLLNDPLAIARGFGPAYPGMPLTQRVLQTLRPVPQWAGSVTPYLGPNRGRTWYDSMQLNLTKRYSHGLDLQGNFVWSKAQILGTGTDTTYFLPGNPVINDIYNLGQNKQLNQLNRPLALKISGTYQTPRLKGDGTATKLASHVLRDWQLGFVLQYQSGQLIQVPSSNNQLMTQLGRGASAVNDGSTPYNVVPGVPRLLVDPNCHCFDPQQTQVLNSAAWVDAPAGQYGTSARFYEGYRWQRQPVENMSFGRNFRMGPERRYVLQMRVEFQNVFNRVFLSTPSSTNPASPLVSAGGILTGGYGSITTLNGAGTRPRTGLFVARFQF